MIETYFKKIINILYLSGLWLLIFLANIMVVTGITFILKGTIGYIQLPISFIISCIELFLLKNKNKNKKSVTISIVLSMIIIICSMFVCSKFYDVYWDSNTYHKDAVGALANGWNPIYEDYLTFYDNSDYRDMDIIGDKLENTHGFWQTYYAKGIWNISANFYYYFHDIEAAKIVNILLAYILFVFVLYVAYNIKNKKVLSVILALIFTITPVNIVQMFSYYNDGALYNALLLTVLSMALFVSEKNYIKIKELYFWIISSIVIVSNIKFTGFAYAGCFCLSLYIVYLINNYRMRTLNKVIRPTIIFASAVIVAICVAGFQPYVTNTINKGVPFYPLMGKDKVDIVTYNEPSEYHDKSTLYKFAYSLFGKSININEVSSHPVELKMPFSIYTEEIDSLEKADTRISGFGVLFSGIFLISIAVIIYGIFKSYKMNKTLFSMSLATIITIIFLILFISESWWARYTPFVYFIPLLATIFLIYNYKSRYSKIVLTVLIVIMLINVNFYVGGNIINNYEEGRNVKKILKKYENRKSKMVVVDTYDSFMGFLYNLDDRNIDYEYTAEVNRQEKPIFRYLKYREE